MAMLIWVRDQVPLALVFLAWMMVVVIIVAFAILAIGVVAVCNGRQPWHERSGWMLDNQSAPGTLGAHGTHPRRRAGGGSGH